MQIIIWLAIGAAVGWLAGKLLRTDMRQAQGGMVVNLVVGIVGALLGVFMLMPMFRLQTVEGSESGFLSMIGAFAGAMILVLVVNFVRSAMRR